MTATDWLRSGRGERPQLRWAFTADAPLTDVRLARESGDVALLDASGGLYLLDRGGRVQALTRIAGPARAVAISDNAQALACLAGDESLLWLSNRLQPKWSKTFAEPILAVALDPFGHHVAIGQANGHNLIFNADQKRLARFESTRPLRFIHFLATTPELVVAAEYGFFGRYRFNGEEVWKQSLWSTVGELSVTGDGSTLYMAGFAHGLQVFAADGNGQGSFILEGTVSHVSSTFYPQKLIAATLERHLLELRGDGTLKWLLQAPEDIARVIVSPVGDYVIVGLQSGRVLRLDLTA